MSLLKLLFGGSDDVTTAAAYLDTVCSDENHVSSLVRHYRIDEVTDQIERQTGARINDSDTAALVQRVRDCYDMGPIADYNLPGYVGDDDGDPVESREDRRSGGLLGWLFRI